MRRLRGDRPGTMTKLTDLNEHELADLLGLSPDKARRWLEVARSIADADERLELENAFGELESVPFLRRSSVEELMGLSAVEVKRLRRTGELHRRFPYLKRKSPEDAAVRLRYLRELLADEVEFEARYPAAWALLFDQPEAAGGLPLPSFEARVLKNDPRGCVLPAGWSQAWKMPQDSGDAFSSTFERRDVGDEEANQGFAPLDVAHMRGVLLAVLGREEYAERVATEVHNEPLRESLGAPAQAQVRLTDLRLATAPGLASPGRQDESRHRKDWVEKSLRPVLASLDNAVTPQRIVG